MRAISFSSTVLLAVVFLPASVSFGQTTATYSLNVEVFWSQSNHEAWAQLFADVTNPHFSHLGGGTHNSNLTIWQPGATVTPGSGMELMQEEGWIDHPNVGTVDLASEFDTHIANGDAFSFLNWPQHFAAGSSTILSLDVQSTHPLVTLTTMLGPTPDWFVGVNGLDLSSPGGSVPSTNGWQNTVVADLFTYDGGSEDGDMNFSLGGNGLVPHVPISLLTDTPNELDPNRTALNSSQMGRFTFELQSVAVPEPSSFVLCGVAALGLLGYGWRRRKNAKVLPITFSSH